MNSEDWKEIAIEYCGKAVKGRYNISEKQITVIAWNGSKTAQLALLPAERIAHMLLRELASEADTEWRSKSLPKNNGRG
jgi:hypothetical protein